MPHGSAYPVCSGEDMADLWRLTAREVTAMLRRRDVSPLELIDTAEARIAAAEQLRDESKATAKQTVRKLDSDRSNGGLQSYNKSELLELAASIGIEGRTNMSKGELVDAITKASRTKR